MSVYPGTHYGSHHGGPPVVYSSGGYGPEYGGGGYPYSGSGYHGGGSQVMYMPSSHRSHRSRRHGGTQIISTGGGGTVISSGGGHHHRSHRHHKLSFGQKLKKFFGFGNYYGGYRHKSESDKSSWGFLGRSRRRRYVDAQTGAEVDRKGRPVYRV